MHWREIAGKKILTKATKIPRKAETTIKLWTLGLKKEQF